MVDTHLTTCGAITLHGPHHVAKQSRTMSVPFSFIASSKSFFEERLCTPCLPMVAEKYLFELRKTGWYMFCSWLVVRSGEAVLMGVLVSSVRLNAEDVNDIHKSKSQED